MELGGRPASKEQRHQENKKQRNKQSGLPPSE
jgi:hypothetical protein